MVYIHDPRSFPQGDVGELPGTAGRESDLPTSSKPYEYSQFTPPHANGSYASTPPQPQYRSRDQWTQQPWASAGAKKKVAAASAYRPREKQSGRAPVAACLAAQGCRACSSSLPWKLRLSLFSTEARQRKDSLGPRLSPLAGPPRPPLAADTSSLFAFPSLVGAIPTGPPTANEIIYRASVGDTLNGFISGQCAHRPHSPAPSRFSLRFQPP